MEWDKSYSSMWRVFRVNPRTWADGELLNNVDSAGVNKTADGRVLESGSMSLSGEFETGYYRIAMTAIQGDAIERIDVATLLFEETGGTDDYGNTFRDINGNSVLYPAYTTSVIVGEYAPAGEDGARYAGDLLRSAINAPVVVEGSFILNEHLVFELGCAVIEAVWIVLDAGNFVLQIDGRGEVHIKPKPTDPALILNRTNTKLLQNEIPYNSDTSEIPNRYVVIVDNTVTTAVNNNENSPVSYPSRGYYIDFVDTSPSPVNGETIDEYAYRKLRELSVIYEEKSYVREYAPNVYLYDIVRATIRGMNGDYRVKSQSINCGNGVTISEKASKEISVW